MKKNFIFKRVLTLVLAVMMLVTAMPVGVLADPAATGNQSDGKFELKYDNGTIVRKEDYINETKNLPVVPKKTENATDLVNNPEMPKLYTVHSDFKVQRGDDLVVSFQPYIATAGDDKYEYTDENGEKKKVLSYTEKSKIDKKVTFPKLDGYTSATPDRKANITYDFIKDRASKHEKVGAEYKGHYDYIYTPTTSTVKVKHLFQDIKDFNKYDKKLGEEDKDYKYTTQQGVTGTSLTIQPLPYYEINGYVPESTNITTQVPENPDNFVVELRYNLAHYNIKYDTAGGTEIPARTLYYGQVIPKIADADIPTKVGGEFKGWKPSVKLSTKDGKTYNANEIIAVGTGQAIKNLDANLIMPANDVTFTAVWKDKEKADYAVQFWAEKADHDDGASLEDKYEYMGTRVYKDQMTGSRPDLDNVSVKDIVFPDLDKARLAKIWAGVKFNRGKDLYLNKFFVYNKALTDGQNGNKPVSSTGKTVYNIYYDRQVYELYFTKSNQLPKENTFYPEIWGYDPVKGEAVMLGGLGNLYHYKARFNEMMYKWPNDAKQTKGFTPGYQSFGWGPNYTSPNWPLHLDTPPYRLNADEFLDMANYTSWGGYTKHIDKGDGTTIDLDTFDFTTLSFGIKQDKPSIPHHMDFWMDGFKDGETIIRYDLVRTKADTAGLGYGHRYPIVTGFTPYGYDPKKQWPSIAEGSQEDGRVDEGRIGELNDERDDITPNTCGTYYNNQGDKLPIGQLNFISVFFSDDDGFGDPIKGGQSFTENGYLQFHYTRNKYPLRFNYDPSIIRDDSYFNSKNQIDTFYEFPLKALSPDVDSNDEYKKVDTKEGPKNLLDNPENLQTLGLTDLVFTDPKDGKLKVKRPENLSDQMVFKGWALDPAGTKLIWENPKETMPFHPVNLFAKWGEPDYKWKVTFDPNGGVLGNIQEENLTQKRKTIQEGDVGQEEKNTYAKKEANEKDKQIFTVIQRQKLVEPKIKPTKKGYDFMGWEVIRYKKDNKGDYTDEIDNSYRETYKVPELYSFGNDVVSPVYLKAIWVESNLIDIKSYHHFLDKDYKELTEDDREIQTLRDRRVGSYLAAVGSRQNAERILVPKDEWEKLKKNNTTELKDSMTYAQYMALDKDHPRVNSYDQQIRIEPEEIPDPNDNTKLIPNPDAKYNVFHFYYRPFRHREYKVNYLDERGRKEVEEFIVKSKEAFEAIKNNANLTDAQKDKEYKDLLKANRNAFEAIREKYAIIDQEAVKNGKRHFDARNYRPIAGWVLDDKPQQQLFFDINEDTNAFYGINETGFDEINFFYKDVRVVETNKNDPVPDGYVRVTFKAADGGSFGNDANGDPIKELYYDVVKGLRSQLLPVPKDPVEESKKEKGKYYITPDNGKNFTKWDKRELLNENTIIEQDYTFTAQYDWSDLKVSSKGLVSTESYIDPDDKWTNEFAPTIDELKNQLVLTKNNKVINNIDEHIVAQLFDEKGKELKTDEEVLKLLSEQNKSDTEELVRRVNIKAKVKFKDQKYKALENEKEGLGDQLEKLKKEDPVDQTKINELEQKIKDTTDAIKAHEAGLTEQELDIPVTIYKNVYEALTNGDKPKVLKDATAPGGDLENVTGNYVKVTVQPTNKPSNKDAKIYYVNPKAWVEISKVDISKDAPNLGFTKWTADKANQNETSGEFDFAKRHKFTEDTVITPNFSEDVKEQKDGEDKPDVPGNFVKVIVDKTANAELGVDEKQTQTFWVNPTKEVTIPVSKPNGKTIPSSGTNQQIAWMFEKWTDDKNLGPWTDTITATFTETLTTITANYKQADNIIPYNPEEPITRPEGYVRVKFDADPGLKLTEQKAYYVKQNSGVKLSDLAHPTYEESTGYKFDKWDKADTTEIGSDPITVTAKAERLKPAIPDDGKPGTKPKGYLEVEFVINNDDKTKGNLEGVIKYFVKPNEYVPLNPPKTTANTGYEFGAWDKDTTIPTIYNEDTIITGSFNGLNDVIKKVDDQTKKPEGYVTVKFELEELDGKIAGNFAHGEITEYFVNPSKEVTIEPPKTSANTGYVFKEWDKDTTTATTYTTPTTVKGTFKKLDDIIPSKDGANAKPTGYVTVTFTKGAHGSSITGETVYYVNPQADPAKILGDPSIVKPEVKADTGYAVNGWDKEDSLVIDRDTTVNAKYDDFDDVIPEKDEHGNPNMIPFNYVKVTFDTTSNGTIENSTETTKVVFVKPNTAVALKGYEPKVEAKAGYDFTSWDVDLTLPTVYNNPKTITAKYNKDNDISKTYIKDYVKVEFKTDPDKGTLKGDTKLWVKPNTQVTLPTPIVIANAGHKFTGWKESLTVNLPKGSQTYVINAQYDNADNIIPEIDSSGKTNAKPDGYVTVTFRADVNGKLEDDKEVIRYFVNPEANIKIVDTVNELTKEIAVPKTKPVTNYVFDKWYESIDKDNSITTDLEYVARFNKGKVTLTYDAGEGTGTPPITVIVDNGTKVRLASATGLSKADASFKGWSIDGSTDLKQDGDEITLTKDTKAVAQWTTDKDIIEYDPVNNPTTRPDDTYVRVTFEADNGLTLTEQKAYYVKKNAGKIIKDLTKPGKTAETGYEFEEWNFIDSTEIKTDIVVKALAKPIGDAIENKSGTQKPDGYVEVKFVAGENGSVEEKSYFVNPNKYVTLTPPTKKANTGFEFGAWSPDPSVPRLYKDQVTKITANFNKLNAVIPKTKDDDSEKPAGYVTVTFEIEGKGGSIAPKETTVFYVKPNTKVTIDTPKTIAKTGYKFNNWEALTKDVSFDKDKTIKGSFTELKDIIDGNEAKPDGYITVTFDKGEHGSKIEGQKVYYVNPKAGKTIGDTEIAKPTVTPETGWKQKTDADAWDKDDGTPITGSEDIVVKAQYTPIDDVIVKTADDDSQKPDGYITVTFDTVDSGKGVISTIITKKVLFVNPNKAVKLTDYAPTVNTKTGYKFARWDTSIERAIQYKDNDTIKALYNEPGDISTKEVYGYVKVEFKPGTNGSLTGTTEYWIKPGVQVNIPVPTVDPNVGFKFKEWDKPLTVTAKANDPTYEITANYEGLPDILPQISVDGSDKPKGYVKVTFKGEHGTLVEPTIYYVNPNKEIWLLQDGFTNTMVKDENADIGYTSKGGEWDVDTRVTITDDKTITYKFKKLDDVIEKIDEKTEQPKGYVKVTLIPTDKAKDEPKENKENKVYFVNPTVNVTIPTFTPTGKQETDANGNKFTYEFAAWASISGVYGAWPNGVIDGIFTQNTDIEAKYTKTVGLAPIAKKGVITQINVEPKPEDLIKNVYDPKDPTNKDNLREGTKFEYTTDGKPDVSKLGLTTAKVKVTYPNGNTVTVEVPVTVLKSVDGIEYKPEDVIPFDPTDLDNPNNPIKRPEGFIKVTFEADAGIRLTEPKAYYVRKNALDKKGNPLKLSALQKPSYELAQGYGFVNWDDDTITIGESDIVVRARANRVVKPDDKPSYSEVIYRDKIVEKEKIVEKIVKVGENDELLKEIRYMQGFNGKFRPYDGLTRAEAAQILANALKADGYRYDANYALSYSDVGNKWYTDAVRVVTQAGVFQGYSDGTFRPQGKITRAEWVATLRRFQDLKEASGNTMMLRSNHWATAEVEAAYEAGWLGVYQNGIAKFDADKPITRQEVAYVSNRAFRRVLDKVYLKRSVNTLLTYKDINPSMPLYEDILCASNTLLTDNRYYKANTVVMDNLTFNIVTDYLRIQQKKFQYNVIR